MTKQVRVPTPIEMQWGELNLNGGGGGGNQ